MKIIRKCFNKIVILILLVVSYSQYSYADCDIYTSTSCGIQCAAISGKLTEEDIEKVLKAQPLFLYIENPIISCEQLQRILTSTNVEFLAFSSVFVNLCRNGGNGVEILANTIVTNEKLTFLQLDMDELDDADALLFANAIKAKKSLGSLVLKRLKLSNKGAQLITRALQENEKILAINLRMFGIEIGSRNKLSEMLLSLRKQELAQQLLTIEPIPTTSRSDDTLRQALIGLEGLNHDTTPLPVTVLPCIEHHQEQPLPPRAATEYLQLELALQQFEITPNQTAAPIPANAESLQAASALEFWS